MTQGGWLRIEGTLTRNGWHYAPKPGHEAARIPSEFLTQLGAQEANDIEAVLLGPGDALMARGKPRLQRSVCGGRQGASPLRVAAYLPLLPGAAAYEVRNAGVVLHRAAIPEAAPAVRIAHCTLDGDTVHVEWQAERAGAGSLHSWVACVLGGRTFPLETLTDRHTLSASIANVPGPGDAHISVMVSDGVRSAVALSEKLSLPARAPVLILLSPTDNSSYGFHEPIALTGQAIDAGGRNLPDQGIQWLCDGQVLAEGTRSALLTNASPGQHQVTLSAWGGQQSVTVTVREQTASEREWAGIFGVRRSDVQRNKVTGLESDAARPPH